MGRPRVYDTPAARMVAYRARHAAQNAPAGPVGAPGYVKWRKAVREARALLSVTHDELEAWMQERSERWQESDRRGDLEADLDELYGVLDTLDELSIRGKA